MRRSCCGVVVLVVGLSLLVASGSTLAQTELQEAKKYTALAEDSLEMSAWVTVSPTDTTAPIIILLPMMGHTHESYDRLLSTVYALTEHDSDFACASGLPHFVSFDLRGHGSSRVRGLDTLSFRGLSKTGFAKYPGDVMTALESAWAQVGKDESGFFVIGASIGANTAMMLTELMPVISKVVLLSPGLDYRGLKPAEALRKFKGDVLIFACEDDQYSATSSRKLAAMNEDHCTLHIFEGSDHGTDIINNDRLEAMRILVDWLCAP